MRALVVGAGLFGSVISAALRRAGHDVTVVADQRPTMASRAAGCVMRPSWVSSLSRAEYDECIGLLGRLYGVQEVTFQTPAIGVVCHWVDPRRVLVRHDEAHSYDGSCYNEPGDFFIHNADADAVVVCTGAFRGGLVPPELEQRVEARRGASFWFQGQLPKSFIQPWAPYRQVVALNMDEETVWVGDGTSLKPENLTQDRLQQSLERCSMALENRGFKGDLRHPVVTIGDRPYVKGLKAPALLEEFAPRRWYATGGAKNGTLGAAWCALRLVEALG